MNQGSDSSCVTGCPICNILTDDVLQKLLEEIENPPTVAEPIIRTLDELRETIKQASQYPNQGLTELDLLLVQIRQLVQDLVERITAINEDLQEKLRFSGEFHRL